MTEPLILTTLRSKQAEIEKHIDGLNARLTDARADLIHLAATIRLFDLSATNDKPATAYHGTVKALRRSGSDLFVRCKAALEASQEALSTRELARHVISAEGWDAEDRRLRITVAHRVATMTTRYERRGLVRNEGLREGVTLWRMA